MWSCRAEAQNEFSISEILDKLATLEIHASSSDGFSRARCKKIQAHLQIVINSHMYEPKAKSPNDGTLVIHVLKTNSETGAPEKMEARLGKAVNEPLPYYGRVVDRITAASVPKVIS